MVKTAYLRNTDDASPFGRLHRPFFWCVFRQSEVTAAVMVVLEEPAQMTRQAGLVENDHVVQALTANGPDQDVLQIAAGERSACEFCG